MMKNLLLLKNSQKGLTLIEILVVIIIMGVLTSITAPNWFTFLNQQKLNKINDTIELTIREGQNRAKRERMRHNVEFRLSSQKELEYRIYNTNSTLTSDPWQTVLDPPENLSLPLSQGSKITFNQDGTIYSLSDITANEKIVVSLDSVNPPTKRCVIVQTLLGALSTGRNTECN